jgi:phosphinothricin acetyltransferase
MAPVLRLATEFDAEQIAAIYAPFVRDTGISFEVVPPSPEEMGRRIVGTVARYPWLVCERGETVAGYAYASRHRERAAYQWSVDVSVYVDPQHQRLGIGRALYTSLFELLRLQGFGNAYAGITLPNASSVGLHEAMGFLPVGVYHAVGYKLGAWYDVGWWALRLRPTHTLVPEPPTDLPDVRSHRDWDAALSAGRELLAAM